MVDSTNGALDTLNTAAEAAQQGVSFLGSISSMFSMVWNAVWTGGIIAGLGWLAYQTPLRPYMDQMFDWLKSTEIGAALLGQLGSFMEMLGFENPFPNMLQEHVAGMTLEEFTERAGNGFTPEQVRALYPLREQLVSSGIIGGMGEITINADTVFNLLRDRSATDDQLLAVLNAFATTTGNTATTPNVQAILNSILSNEERRNTLLNERGTLLQQIVQQYTGASLNPEQLRGLLSSGIDFNAAMNIAQRVRDQGLDAFVASITTDTPAAATDRRTLLTLLQTVDGAILPESLREHAAKVTTLLTAIDSDPAVRTAVQQLSSGGHLQSVLSYAQGETSLAALGWQVGMSNLGALNTIRTAMGESPVPERTSAATLPETPPGIAAAVAEVGLSSTSVSGGEEGSPATQMATLHGLGSAAQAAYNNTVGRFLGS